MTDHAMVSTGMWGSRDTVFVNFLCNVIIFFLKKGMVQYIDMDHWEMASGISAWISSINWILVIVLSLLDGRGSFNNRAMGWGSESLPPAGSLCGWAEAGLGMNLEWPLMCSHPPQSNLKNIFVSKRTWIKVKMTLSPANNIGHCV